jgi:hypothetical protein
MFQFGKREKRVLTLLFVGAVLFFTAFQYRALFLGARIVGGNYTPYLNLTEPSYELKVQVKWLSSASLNGRELLLHPIGDQLNEIRETITFHPPYDEAILELQDLFGRTKTYPISAVIREKEPST